MDALFPLPLAAATLALALIAPPADAASEGDPSSTDTEWNQFRGPHGSGVAAATCQPPLTPGPDSLAWRTAVPPGLSSPVITGSHVILTGVENGRLVTLAMARESGAITWRREAPDVRLEPVHSTNSPATPTPLVIDGRLHVYFGSFGLLTYDLDGTELWRLPLDTPKSLYGAASSPIASGDNLILVLDNEASLEGSTLSRSRLIAVSRSTGTIQWETPRPLVRSGWSTPILWSHPQRSELVVLGSGRVISYDPATGQELWHAAGFSQETIAQPAAGNGLIFVSASQIGGGANESIDPQPLWNSIMTFDANGDGRLHRSEMTGPFTFPLRPELPPGHPGYGLPMPSDPEARRKRLDGLFASVDKDKDGLWSREEFAETAINRPGKPRLLALRPGATGEATATHLAWELNRQIPEIPTPLFLDGRLFLVRNGGLLSAVNAADGQLVYTERLGSPGHYSASPVAAAGHLFLLSNQGWLSVVKAGDTFQLTHRVNLGEECPVTPAIDQNSLYIRTASHLHAYRKGK